MLGFYVLLVPLCGAYGDVLYAHPGDNVTLSCFYTASSKHLSWYKQVAGQQPQIVSYFYESSSNSNKFFLEFESNERFSVHVGKGFYNLNISNVQDWDSAMYYCGHMTVTVTEFETATFLILKDSSCRARLLQHPDSDATQTESDTRTHQCEVALCGEILFGTGKGLRAGGQQSNAPSVLVYCGAAALLVSGIFNIILCCISCQKSRRKGLHSEGSHNQPEYTADK
ncbi:uncharacterized protein LOC133420450 [Cololabis saira]|uniref:uncharacterized protein LOC133420450 n=1 Tax=Cololabis saira TaxID=129043 RepID=UPI002AD55916|nr:uncharacterized protein LOC133420450 [Cololabis saira]